MDELDTKLNQYYGGKVVRKDVTKSIKKRKNDMLKDNTITKNQPLYEEISKMADFCFAI